METFARKGGFSLVEVIIVVVILGILAAVALPRITFMTRKAAAAEAFGIYGSWRKAFYRCMEERLVGSESGPDDRTDALVLCDSWAEIGMTDPSSSNFRYELGIIPWGAMAVYGIYFLAELRQDTSANIYVEQPVNSLDWRTGATGEIICTPEFEAFCAKLR